MVRIMGPACWNTTKGQLISKCLLVEKDPKDILKLTDLNLYLKKIVEIYQLLILIHSRWHPCHTLNINLVHSFQV